MPSAMAHSSNVSRSRPSLRSASSHLLRSEPENCARPSLTPASLPTSLTPRPVSALRSYVGPLVGAGELHGGDAPRSDDVVHLVVALVEHAGHLHPPVDVPVPVDARRAHVLADGEDHLAARASDFVRDLHAGRRCADHHHRPLAELLGVAVLHRGHRRHRRRHGRRTFRQVRPVERTGRDDHGRAGPFGVVRGDVVAVAAAVAAHRGHRRTAHDGRVDRLGVPADEVDHLGHRHEAVRVGPFVGLAGESALPVGSQQPERVPALPPPRAGDLVALQEDVVDRTFGQAPAHRQPALSGADHDDRGVHSTPKEQEPERVRRPRRSRWWGS